jgi:hypothetical protein
MYTYTKNQSLLTAAKASNSNLSHKMIQILCTCYNKRHSVPSHISIPVFCSPFQTDVVKIINFNSPIDGCLGEEDRDRRDLKDGEWTDARLDPLATLRSYLPMSGDSDWPRLLESYLEPGKRQEDHDGHLKIPGQWPKD